MDVAALAEPLLYCEWLRLCHIERMQLEWRMSAYFVPGGVHVRLPSRGEAVICGPPSVACAVEHAIEFILGMSRDFSDAN